MESTLAPQHDIPAPVPDETNGWCIDEQYQIYRDAKFLNDKGVITRTLTVERRVLIRSLHTVPAVDDLFTRHRLE